MATVQPDTRVIPAPARALLCVLMKIEELHLRVVSQPAVELLFSIRAAVQIETFTGRKPGHGRRTAASCVMLGRALGLPSEELHDLTLAGLLHDVGLLMFDPEFLAHPDACDADGYADVQSHPRLSAELLSRFMYLAAAARAIAHHHERWDGNGYPFGLRKQFIPLESRILAIAAAHDAAQVASDTDTQLSRRLSLRIIQSLAGSRFDPALVEIFAFAVEAEEITCSNEYFLMHY